MRSKFCGKFMLFSFFVFIVVGVFAQDTTSFKTYYENGLAKYKSKDYTGAVSDFNNAINKNSDIPSNMAVAYYFQSTL